MELPKSFAELIQMVISPSGGGFLIISWFASWVLEYFAFWKNLETNVKRVIILWIAVILGIGATELSFHPDVVKAIEPYANTVMATIAAWLTTQVAHSKNPNRKK